MKKPPQEFYILDDEPWVCDAEFKPEGSLSEGAIHVIEKSALTDLQKEFDATRKAALEQFAIVIDEREKLRSSLKEVCETIRDIAPWSKTLARIEAQHPEVKE